MFGTMEIGGLVVWVPLVAVVCSGGSAFWAQVVSYASAAKDARRAVEDSSKRTPSPVNRQAHIRAGAAGIAQLALLHLRERYPESDFVSTGSVRPLGGGEQAVSFVQLHQGIPLYQSLVVVTMDGVGHVRRLQGAVQELPLDLVPTPQTTALRAVGGSLPAGFHAVGRWRDVESSSQTAFFDVTNGSERGSAAASLTWVTDRREGTAQLAWRVQLTLTGDEHETVIAADGPGKVLAGGALVQEAVATGWIRRFDEDALEEAVRFPPDPPLFQTIPKEILDRAEIEWVTDDTTIGNYTMAVVGSDHVVPTIVQNGNRVFNASTDSERAAVNAFYFCNLFHDFFEALGFDERWGSFQHELHGDAGVGGDRLCVRIVAGNPTEAAKISYGLDGSPLVMQLGSHNGRHSAFDAEVLAHEYAHGVVNRILSRDGFLRPLADLTGWKPQSAAMAEGYSDYFALTIVNHLRRARQEAQNWAFGRGFAGDRGAGGLRAHSYSDAEFPTDLSFGDLVGLDAYDGGQIWAKALLRVHERLRKNHPQGETVAWRLVIESLKRLVPGPDAPGFLAGRDELLFACDRAGDFLPTGMVGSDVRSVILEEFARLGMASSAEAVEFADAQSIREAFQ